MEERSFLALRIEDRVQALRTHAEYLGSRTHAGHQVHLYRMDGYFVELWMRLGTRIVEWVEVARNTEILTEYVRLDLKGLIGDH